MYDKRKEIEEIREDLEIIKYFQGIATKDVFEQDIKQRSVNNG